MSRWCTIRIKPRKLNFEDFPEGSRFYPPQDRSDAWRLPHSPFGIWLNIDRCGNSVRRIWRLLLARKRGLERCCIQSWVRRIGSQLDRRGLPRPQCTPLHPIDRCIGWTLLCHPLLPSKDAYKCHGDNLVDPEEESQDIDLSASRIKPYRKKALRTYEYGVSFGK